jgi:hypothetical protein
MRRHVRSRRELTFDRKGVTRVLTRSGPRCGCQIALQQATERLLDYLVGERQQRRRDREVDCFGGLEVDNELEFGGLLHR